SQPLTAVGQAFQPDRQTDSSAHQALRLCGAPPAVYDSRSRPALCGARASPREGASVRLESLTYKEPTTMRNHRYSSLTRREILRLSAAGVAGASVSGWFGQLAEYARAAAPPTRLKSCVLLWMDGGPSHHDTFDPKPEAGAEIRGDLKAIDTSVSGIQISEKFPRFAKLMKHAALLRGMSTEEGDHARARVHLHTGYKPGAGGTTYPTLGSTVAAELE